MINENNTSQMFQEIKDILETVLRKQSINQKKEDEKYIIDAERLARMLNVSSSTVFKWTKDGIIKYSPIGGKFFFKMSDVLDFIDRHQVPLKKK